VEPNPRKKLEAPDLNRERTSHSSTTRCLKVKPEELAELKPKILKPLRAAPGSSAPINLEDPLFGVSWVPSSGGRIQPRDNSI